MTVSPTKLIDLHVMSDGSIRLTTQPGHEPHWPEVAQLAVRMQPRGSAPGVAPVWSGEARPR